MKKIFLLLILAVVVVSCSKKSDSTTTNEFSNKLQFGTGLNPGNLFQLTGVGTTFPVSSNIYFRLESVDDMAGSAVRLKIDDTDGNPIFTQDYPNPQSYGHIMLSNFTMTRTGNFVATGILVANLKTVATANFTIN